MRKIKMKLYEYDQNTRSLVIKTLVSTLKDLGYRSFVIDDETSLNDDIGLDDIDLLEVVASIEEEFSIEVTDSDINEINDIDTLGAIIDLIEEKIQLEKERDATNN
jgi:acyl carrier protein